MVGRGSESHSERTQTRTNEQEPEPTCFCTALQLVGYSTHGSRGFLPFVDILTHLNPKPSTLNPRLLREDLRVSTVKESPFLDARALRLWLSKLATDWV